MLLSLLAIYATNLFSQTTEIIVTADRIESERDKRTLKTKSVSKGDLKNDLSVSLAKETNISVVRSGGPGTSTFLSLRGLDSKYTLVLIDGIEMNDPSNPTRSFDFATLDTSNIDHVEVYEGANALLYGADAVGGVVNIITKRGQGNLNGELKFGLGNHHHQKIVGQISSKNSLFSESTAISVEKYLGDSIATEKSNPGAEEDGFRKINFSTNLVFDSFAGFDEQQVSFRMMKNKTSLDAFGGAGGDDNDRISRGDEIYSLWKGKLFLHEGMIELIPAVNYSQNRRKVVDGRTHDHYFGSLKKVALQSNFYWSETNKSIAGLEVESESDLSMASNMSKDELTTESFFVDQHLALGNYDGTAGARVDYHPVFKNEESYRLNMGRKILLWKSRLGAGYSTSYKSPTLFQLYSKRYGRESLVPEKSISIEAEYVFTPVERWDLSLNLYQTKIKNRISYDSVTFISENRGAVKISGAALQLKQSGDVYALTLSQNFLRAKNEANGDRLLRKSNHTSRASVEYTGVEKTTFAIDGRYEGEQDDSNPMTGKKETLDSYVLFNFMVNYQVQKNVNFKFTLDNLLNEYYEESFGLAGTKREFFLEATWQNSLF